MRCERAGVEGKHDHFHSVVRADSLVPERSLWWSDHFEGQSWGGVRRVGGPKVWGCVSKSEVPVIPAVQACGPPSPLSPLGGQCVEPS